jgi:hypothetical protein
MVPGTTDIVVVSRSPHPVHSESQSLGEWLYGSFNSRLRDKLLSRELFLSLAETLVVLDLSRFEYNQQRPHGSLGWQTPSAFAAHLEAPPAGAFPANPPVESPFGAAPLTPTQLAE